MDQPIDFPDLEAFAENNYSKELDDLDDILSFSTSKHAPFAGHVETNDVTLIGHSRGGGICIIKASEDARVSKLVTWAAVSDFGKRSSTSGELEEWKRTGVKYVLNSRTKQQMPHHIQFYEDFKKNESRLHIESAEKALQIPHLIIHGSADDAVSLSEARQLHSWNAASELVIIENANHVFNTKHPWEQEALPQEIETLLEHTIQFIKD